MSRAVKLRHLLFPACAVLLASCAHEDRTTLVRVSVPNQKMMVFKKGVHVATYDCSTSKFGLGDRPGSNRTPLGRMKVAAKVGGGQPSGMKFKSRRPTGEIVKPDAPGRDPIVSRILWLKGLESQNRNAYRRTIYIHGTAEERTIGSRTSYGCIRMRSRDVIELYGKVGVGAIVEVTLHPFPEAVAASSAAAPAIAAKMGAPAPAPAPKRVQSVGTVTKVAPRG
jgi:hypothetical protein